LSRLELFEDRWSPPSHRSGILGHGQFVKYSPTNDITGSQRQTQDRQRNRGAVGGPVPEIAIGVATRAEPLTSPSRPLTTQVCSCPASGQPESRSCGSTWGHLRSENVRPGSSWSIRRALIDPLFEAWSP